jgi:Transposase DNA-binding
VEIEKMLEWWTKNFASCQFGDERLSNRAFWIGKALSQNFGKAISRRNARTEKTTSGTLN